MVPHVGWEASSGMMLRLSCPGVWREAVPSQSMAVPAVPAGLPAGCSGVRGRREA